MSSKNIAVIGAGMAGLTAAQKLLAGGARVTIIDKAQPGGRASSVVKDGFHINQGPHALYKGGSAYRILSELKIKPAGATPQPKRTLIIKGDKLFDLPTGAGTIVTSQLLSIADKIEWVAFFTSLAKIDTSESATELQGTTISAWLNDNVKSENVRILIKSMVRLGTYANCPDEQSAWSALKQLQIATNEGVEYIDGGWQKMVDGMRSFITGRAEEIYGATVASVRSVSSPDAAAHVDVVINGETRQFDGVILALPPLQVQKLLGQTGRFDHLEPVHAACLDVCLNKLTNSDIFAIGYDEALYYSVHSATANLTAEKGQALIHLAVYLKPGEVGSHSHEERLLKVLQQLQPGWQNELVYKRYLPNMVASYGVGAASRMGDNGQLNVSLADVPQVYVCGDWVGKGELLLDAAMASAERAVEAALSVNVPKETVSAAI
jgi:protoporphyrinogen oxidase